MQKILKKIKGLYEWTIAQTPMGDGVNEEMANIASFMISNKILYDRDYDL